MTGTQEPQSFIDYWDAVDVELMKHFFIDTSDAGIEPDMLADAQEEGQTAEDFALWFGAKYGLTPPSKFKATRGRA
jgi:hypothetical protein